ncbi:MAG: hypothetical protein IJU74_03620, partial [Bacteroidales bacterium]|nr:hypothetical protein [Bacteroidales bacterium]
MILILFFGRQRIDPGDLHGVAELTDRFGLTCKCSNILEHICPFLRRIGHFVERLGSPQSREFQHTDVHPVGEEVV